MGAEVTALGEPAALHAQGCRFNSQQRGRGREMRGGGGGDNNTQQRSQKKKITNVYFGYVNVMAKLCKRFGLNMLSLCNLQIFYKGDMTGAKGLNDLKAILVNHIIIFLRRNLIWSFLITCGDDSSPPVV